jgi:S-adenosylmethionine:tRNA ribosyltransferase-isomerase
MSHPRNLSIDDFSYHLPDSRIARHPAPVRDQSKLLVYKGGNISKHVFFELSEIIDGDCMLVLNNTKVIPARLIFKKTTGGEIEIFCLDPIGADHQAAMASKQSTTWKCLVGGAKKWKEGALSCSIQIRNEEVVLFAEKGEQQGGEFVIHFQWNNEKYSFSELLQAGGELPLPPYFDREPEQEDLERYQTIFARFDGSVAAPTAALHFTENVFSDLKAKGVSQEYITLHVGAGTFKPVSSDRMEQHDMHAEVFTVECSLIEKLAAYSGKIIGVGTTTTRTLESLYWMGVKILEGQKGDGLYQWECYDLPNHYSLQESFGALLNHAMHTGQSTVSGATSLLIAPGYTYRVCKGIITNFHLPKSTLILLVAALVGDDWRKIYDYALANEFNFLSYGDSSLLLP